MGKTIGVISLKGGVGKTSVVASLGDAIADFGKKVLLIDGNLSSPSLGLHLNLINPEKTLHHVLDRSVNTKDAIYEFGNFHLMPASIFDRVDVNPLALRDRIKGLKRLYDFIIIDSSPALDAETLAVMSASDEILAVTTPDRPTLSATIKAVNFAKRKGTPIAGIVLNKVHNKSFEIPFEDIEETLDVPILAVVPYDVKVLESLAHMTPYTSHKPNSKGSVEYKKLAASLIGEKFKPFSFGDFFRLSPKKQEVNRELYYKSAFR